MAMGGDDSIKSSLNPNGSHDVNRSSDLSVMDADHVYEGFRGSVFPTTSHTGNYRARPTDPASVFSQEQLEDQEYQKRWNNTLHTYPDIQYAGISSDSAVNRLQTNAGRVLKRKMEVTNSNMSPSRKQHITEEKMAACMQGLSLEREQIRRSTKNVNNDSDFEDDSDIEEEHIEEESIDPIFELHADLKDYLKKLTSIVPENVVDEMKRVESANWAVVPYIPRDSLFLSNSAINNDEEVGENEMQSNNNSREEPVDDSNMLVNAASSCDNDFMFD